MRFRNRVLLTSILLVWVPLIVLTLVIRKGMADRLAAEHGRRVETLVGVLEQNIESRTAAIHAGLADLRTELKDNNRFRLLAVEGMAVERGYVLDYAHRAMRLLGLSMLQIQDSDGRILSSGHFRNEYDRVDADLPRLLSESPNGYALVTARTSRGFQLELSCVDSVSLGDRTFTLVGGLAVRPDFLSSLVPDSTLGVSIVYSDGAVSSLPHVAERLDRSREGEGAGIAEVFPASRFIVRRFSVPYVVYTPPNLDDAVLLATYPLAPLHALLRSLDIWLGALVLIAVVGTLVVSLWVSARMSRPLVDLAEKTSGIDLERLDVDFESRRKDEVGDLSRFLGSMIERLKAGAAKLREAERRAALGDLARQVNHDVRNGLTPIRNTFRHLNQVVREDPRKLETVFRERAGALDSSIGYLEGLADNYSRLYRRNPRKLCDLNGIARETASARGATGRAVHLDLDPGLPIVHADPIALRRIVDNLVTNAEESMGKDGTVSVRTTAGRGKDGGVIATLEVVDTGPGISEELLEKIFDDFYTTKKDGAGLGLSIVRRMVADCGGSVRAESEAGHGARFVVELPAANGGQAPPSTTREDQQ